MKHGSSQFTGKRILLAWMVGSYQSHSPWQAVNGAVTKLGNWPESIASPFTACHKILIERDFSQHHDDPYSSQCLQFAQYERPASEKFLYARLVGRRGAPHRRADITIRKGETVIHVGRGLLIREAESVQRFV